MRAVVIGAGVAGLGSALALGRAGHQVTLLERDATPLPASAEEAFGWDRRGAPQVRHSHALLARLRNLLRDRYPDVLDDLLEVGVTEIRFAEMMPDTIADRSPRPGDDDLVALAGRRTTFEWVLRRAALADDNVEIVDGTVVAGLRGGERGPLVTGVDTTRAGATRVFDADLVVSAEGRRSPLPAWLADIGVELPEVEEDTGIVYYSRFFRLRDPVRRPVQNGPIGGDLGYLKYAIFQGDNDTFSVTLACQVDDAVLRKKLLDPAAFGRAATALAATSAWADPAVADPITPVHVMAQLVNRRRRFLDDEGEPRLLGLHAVGDAHTCTNPLYGRGCSLAMVQATLLADAVAAHPADPRLRAVTYERACEQEVLPWYRAAVTQDRMNSEARAVADGAPVSQDGAPLTAEASGTEPALPTDMIRDLLRDGLFPALRVDPVVFRAFLRMFNLLTLPDALLTDGEVISRVMAVYQDRDDRPPEPALGPDRRKLLAELG